MAKFNSDIMNRREFLKISAATTLSSFLPLHLSKAADTSIPLVWEVEGSPNDGIRSIFSAMGGIETLISKELSKATVLIKPNICLPHQAEMGTTTSPEVVESICNYLLNKGIGKIIIADHTLQKTNNFKRIALNRLIEKYEEVKLMLADPQQLSQPIEINGTELKMEKHQDVKLIFANQQRLFNPIDVNGKVLKTTEIFKIIPRVDLLINLPTAKHHAATQVSLAIKNLMGLIWNREEFHTRFDLPQAIADLAMSIRPGLNIIDASRVLLNGGPVGPGPIIKENRLETKNDLTKWLERIEYKLDLLHEKNK